MKITSGKKAILYGLIYGIVTFAVYVLYTCIIDWILGGENFVYKTETRDVVNGVSFVTTQTVGVIVSASIPILLLRYKSIKYYIASVFVAFVIYICLYLSIFIYFPLGEFFFEYIYESPINSFDSLAYGIFSFPLGAVIGILINAVINFLRNEK